MQKKKLTTSKTLERLTDEKVRRTKHTNVEEEQKKRGTDRQTDRQKVKEEKRRDENKTGRKFRGSCNAHDVDKCSYVSSRKGWNATG